MNESVQSVSVRLGNVTEVVMGQAPPSEDCNRQGRGTPFVKAGEFEDYRPVVREWTTNPLKVARSGDVLVCVVGATAGKINESIDCAIGRSVAALRPDPSSLWSKYLYHFLGTQVLRLRAKSQGLAQGVITRDTLQEISIPLPSIPEQRRIAAILDKADELRAKRRAALAQLDTLTQSIFLDMFGDPGAQGWPMSTVDEISAETEGSIRTGPFGSQLLHSEFTDDGIAVLGIDNVVENKFRWAQRRYISEAKYRQLRRYTVRPGDVLITIMGTCGRCVIVPDDIPTAINTKHLCCISLDRTKCLPVFLHEYFLRHPIARRYLAQKAKGAIMEGLNMSIIKEMPIPRAPIPLQEAFAAKLEAVIGLMRRVCQSETTLGSLFASLQHRAFRGEL